MSLRIALLGVAALLAACGGAKRPAADGAWVRLPAVSGRPGAAYVTLRGGTQAATLLAIATPAAVRTELHESMKGDHGMMSMTPLAQLDIPAGGSVALAPGGRHAMLFDVNPALRPGGTTTLSLKFADGRTITTEAKLVGAGDAAP